jgi:ferredoxin-type protein NapH
MNNNQQQLRRNRRKHVHKRLLYFIIGMLLFVAPFALFMTASEYVLQATDTGFAARTAQSEPTVHRAMCLRMPLVWAVWNQETFLGRVWGNPLYLLVFLLIGLSLFIGPLFCGWLCPGGMTEHLSKLVPSKYKLDFKETVDPAPVRYGFLAGFFLVASPFVNKSVCCAYCNWTWIENVWAALFLDFEGVTGGGFFAYSSSSILTFLLTFVLLGVFMEGGRGWCNFLCPAGALQNLAHAVGARLPFTYRLRLSKDKCNDCFQCVKACSTWAIKPSENSVAVNLHLCNGCTDCVSACPSAALEYTRGGV